MEKIMTHFPETNPGHEDWIQAQNRRDASGTFVFS